MQEALCSRAQTRAYAQKLLRQEGESGDALNVLLLLLDCLSRLKAGETADHQVWQQYAQEMYSQTEGDNQEKDFDERWAPPLPVAFFRRPLGDPLELAEDCVAFLIPDFSRKDGQQKVTQLVNAPTPIFATYDDAWYRNIGKALSDLRIHSENLDTLDLANMFRSIFTSVLERHFGADHFSQASPTNPTLRNSFAANQLDSDAIRNFYIRRDQRDGPLTTEDGLYISRHRTTKSDSDILNISNSPKGMPDSPNSALDKVGEIVSPTSARSHRRAMSSESRNTPTDLNIKRISSMSFADDTSTLRSNRSYGSTAQLLQPQTLTTPTRARKQEEWPLQSPKSPAPFTGESIIPIQPGSPAADLPLTVNELSPGQRRDLVKRSKKLQQKLGVQLDEEVARKALSSRRTPFDESGDSLDRDPSYSPTFRPSRSRSSSFPPPSPTSPTSFSRLSEVALRTSDNRPTVLNRSTTMSSVSSDASDLIPANDLTTSPETNYSPMTPFDFQSMGMNWKPPLSADDIALKEERRRRVQKVYALLGEYVPVSAVLGEGIPAPHRSKHSRNPSRLEQASGAITRGFGKFRKRKEIGASSGGSTGSEEDWQQILPYPQHPSILASADGQISIEALRRAQKLERLLGELPPQSLNVSRFPPLSHPRDRRDSISVNTAFDDDLEETHPVHPFNEKTGLKHAESLNSLRRTSIAALQLQYLAENQPQVLAASLSAIYGSKSPGPLSDEEDSDFETPEQPLGRLSFLTNGRETRMSGAPSEAPSGFEIDDTPPTTAVDLRRNPSSRSRSGSEGQRQLRKAAKLARFFGTTRNEVLTKVLEDLELEIESDEESTTDERQSVLASVRRMRASMLVQR